MTSSATESHNLRGASDGRALRRFRDVFERQEPLATGTFDDLLNPQRLELHLADGTGAAERARIDVRWSTVDDYNIHYTEESGINLRWDIHPHDYPIAALPHFHPPPDASTDPQRVEPSCIRERRIEIVARATHKLWRHCYDKGSFENANGLDNPP